ncbi:hypothetical protein PMAYCL1PPCAC_21907, partial [Pristionchus mayeri]
CTVHEQLGRKEIKAVNLNQTTQFHCEQLETIKWCKELCSTAQLDGGGALGVGEGVSSAASTAVAAAAAAAALARARARHRSCVLRAVSTGFSLGCSVVAISLSISVWEECARPSFTPMLEKSCGSLLSSSAADQNP